MTKYAGALPYRKEREIDHCDVNGICRLIALNETFQSVRVWTQIRAVEKRERGLVRRTASTLTLLIRNKIIT